MPLLTGFILGAFVAYGAGWYLGMFEGNFALLMLLATLVSGVYWVAERWLFLPKRKAAAAQLQAQAAQRRDELSRMGIAQTDVDVSAASEKLIMQPWWLDWTCLLYTSPSPRDYAASRMPSSA